MISPSILSVAIRRYPINPTVTTTLGTQFLTETLIASDETPDGSITVPVLVPGSTFIRLYLNVLPSSSTRIGVPTVISSVLTGMAYVTDPSGRFVASSELSTISVVTPKNGGIAIAITRMIVHTTTKCTINFKNFDITVSLTSVFLVTLIHLVTSLYPVFFFRSTYNLDKKSAAPELVFYPADAFFQFFTDYSDTSLYWT